VVLKLILVIQVGSRSEKKMDKEKKWSVTSISEDYSNEHIMLANRWSRDFRVVILNPYQYSKGPTITIKAN